MTGTALAEAPKTDTAAATARGRASQTDVDDLPSLDQIRAGNGNFQRANRLDPKVLSEALRSAKDLDLNNDNSLVDFGTDLQRSASRLAEKTVEYSRRTDFDAITKITLQIDAKQRELRIGDLKPRWSDRLLPKALANRVNGVLDQHKDIKEGVRGSVQALAEEKKKLIQYRGAAEADINESITLIDGFDKSLAILELKRAALDKQVARYMEEHKDSTDERVAQQLKLFDMRKGLLERKVLSMTTMRTDQYTTLENLKNFQATYNVLIEAAEDQVNYNKQAFDNTTSVLTHAARQKGMSEALATHRAAAGEWLKARGDAAVKTVEQTMEVLQVGVVELDRVMESLDRSEEANLKLINGCKEAQVKLKAMTQQMGERAALAAERTAQAARGSQEEVAGMISELAGARLPGRPN